MIEYSTEMFKRKAVVMYQKEVVICIIITRVYLCMFLFPGE